MRSNIHFPQLDQRRCQAVEVHHSVCTSSAVMRAVSPIADRKRLRRAKKAEDRATTIFAAAVTGRLRDASLWTREWHSTGAD